MQTKKRAKPIKFGKAQEEKRKEILEELEKNEREAVTDESSSEEKESPEIPSKEEVEADIHSPETEEIKKIVEERVHAKEESDSKETDEDKEVEDEPMEVNLSEELSDEKNEDASEEPAESSSEEKSEESKESSDDSDEAKAEDEKEEISEEPEKSAVYGSFTNDEGRRKQKKTSLGFFLLVAFITFIVGLAFIAGISYTMSLSGKKPVTLSVLQKATPTPTAEPTVTPIPEVVDLSIYSIRILNGSGITGEAAKAKSLLVDGGFKVATVGNAATSDYTKTVITAKKDIEEAYLNKLVKALQGQYSVNSVVEDAPSSQTADVVITVGSDSAK